MSNFRSRTLKARNVDDKILSEDVIFYAFGFCKACNEYINLMNLCSDLSNLKTKKEGEKDLFKCPNKHQKNSNEYVPLRMALYFGVELFNIKLKNINRQSTASYNIIELLSPTTMKKQLLKIAKELGENKFNVEMFKEEHKELFWNLVWFFELNNMDISFMLPYSYESCNILNDNYSEKIKKAVITKYKREQDIDIAKIVKDPDLNVSIIFYGKISALGEKTEQNQIINNIFTNIKYKYFEYDLVIQTIFQFEINSKIGMISYNGFNTYSENIGYNEYPVQFEDLQTPEHYNSFFSFRSTSKGIDGSDLILLSSCSSILNNVQNKNNSFTLVMNKTEKVKNVSFGGESVKNALTFKKLKSGGGGILKNTNINQNNENNKKIKTKDVDINEDIDFLSKFKESQKNLETDLKVEKKEDNTEQITTNKELRKSTLKNGILFEETNENNNEYYDDED